MAVIGKIDKQGNGRIKTLAHRFQFKMLKVPTPQGNEPTHKFKIEDVEIGAGWKKTSETGRDYVSATFDDPSFPAPLNVAIFEDGDGEGYDVVWSRRKEAPKPEQAEAA